MEDNCCELSKPEGNAKLRLPGPYCGHGVLYAQFHSGTHARWPTYPIQPLYMIPSPQEHMRTGYRQFSTTPSFLDPVSRHNEIVKGISVAVREFYKRKEKFRIYHGSTNSTRSSVLKKNLVDTSSLSNVLKIDVEKKTCLVEPNVSMDRLVEATLKHGLVPPVVMEFPGITVGGGYSGTSGESSSFKHGFFDRTINRVEMVLADGEVVSISPNEKGDLFNGAAGAVGSMGVTTMVELQLHEAKKYVETTYHPVANMKDAISKLKDFTSNNELDYVDGIMFSKSQGAIVTGCMTDEVKEGVVTQNFSNAFDPWFYLHVQDKITNNPNPTVEAIPLGEYLFRYDRGGFWVALHASGQSKKYVVQDLALPYSTAEEFVNYTDSALGIYPLWLCPLKQNPLPTMHPQSNEYEADGKTLKQMLNVGLWGFGPQNHADFIKANRDLERKLRELGGMKWLYAHTYYDEAEFWQMYDRKWYDGLRAKYGATSLPSVYEKVKVDVGAEKKAEESNSTLFRWLINTWPFGGLYGIRKAIASKTYLAARKATWRTYRRSG
ncbi:hypothetical protein B0O99DRAFT_593244 [Bisporella sp. PMI_857]|nr:hypothetical protein B0O99DRAFT_593244 [Bisporella sp. PMI_857]